MTGGVEGENWKAEGGPREERREMERRKGRKVLVGRRQRAKEGYGEMVVLEEEGGGRR